jgi:hypothetical protein
MDELYGIHSTATDFTVHPSLDNYLVNNYGQSFPSPVPSFGDRIPVFRPDRLLSGSVSSVVSDAASMVAEIQRGGSEEEVSGATRAKIASHPLYPKLLQAYIDCQKVNRLVLFVCLFVLFFLDSPFGCWENVRKMKLRTS